MPSLGPAYWGYLHQDILTAYALASLVTSGATIQAVTADRKLLVRDCFDDLLTTSGTSTCRTQIKSHASESRQLKLSDLITDAIDFRIDRVLATVQNDPSGADEYHLLVTFDDPDPSLEPYVTSAPSQPALLPALRTNQYMISAEVVWPNNSAPVWPHLNDFTREAFVAFCAKFVIETHCPRASGDLRIPGKLELELLRLLRDGVGVSLPPNQDRDLPDAAAHLIYRAITLRADRDSAKAADIIRTLALRVDYGRVTENLAVNESLLVNRESTLNELVERLNAERRVVLVGPPGSGKSWLMRMLRSRLLDDGWLAVVHYCFLDLWDSALDMRATSQTIFGSLMAELIDLEPALVSDRLPRYAAGPAELEQLLKNAYSQSTGRRIALIVDGLDHADRPSKPYGESSAALAQELAALDLPPNVVLVIGSQPGAHLDELSPATPYEMPAWSPSDIEELLGRIGVTSVRSDSRPPTANVADVIVDRAGGNPLYATYLSRSVVQLEASEPGIDATSLMAHIAHAPGRDQGLVGYYDWLLQPVVSDEGAKFVIGLIAAAGFTLTSAELGEIVPPFSHHVHPVLRQLSPVLIGGADAQGVRIYHESFQRYARDKLLSSIDALRAALDPIIGWLESKGFFEDVRAFRFLPELLFSVGHDREIAELFTVDYVAKCIAAGLPGDAAAHNLAIGARAAAKSQWWTVLARLVELSRATNHFYNWRLDDDSLAEAYGRALLAMLGPEHLVQMLAYDGRCTFRPRAGLVLCELCDEAGVTPPWSTYLDAYDRFRKTDNTVYSRGETAVIRAWVTGRFRQIGAEGAVRLALDLTDDPEVRLHRYDIAMALGRVYGESAVRELRDQTNAHARGWVQLSVAALNRRPVKRTNAANRAISIGLPMQGLRIAQRLGANISSIPFDPLRLEELTVKMCDPKGPDSSVTTEWLVMLDIAKAHNEPDALLRAMLLIGGDFWYRRWLRFAVALRRESDFAILLRDLEGLATKVEVFVGEPRVVDLYRIHDDIQESFEALLRLATDREWIDSIEVLSRISRSTIAWVSSTRSGPLPVDALLEMCGRTARNQMRRAAASAAATRLLDSEAASAEVYDTHATDHLLRARLLIRSNTKGEAWSAWESAAIYLAGYGFRKDITIFEVIDALPSFASADLRVRINCLKKTQVLAERLLVHTDLSETRGAIHSWIDIAAKLDPPSCLVQIARESLLRHPTFGNLEHAVPAALIGIASGVQPIAQLDGWLAAGSEVRAEPNAALAACEVAMSDELFPVASWSVIAAALVGDGLQFDSKLSDAVSASVERLGLDPVTFMPRPTDKSESPEQPGPTAEEVETQGPSAEFTSMTSLQLLSTLRRLRSGRARVATDVVSKTGSWLAATASSSPAAARSVLQGIAYDTKFFYADPFLTNLAEFCETVGLVRLSAACWTYAYTRTTDGWRRFGGSKYEWMFRRAMQLDQNEAWQTLADEVAVAVSEGGPVGVNLHTIELLASVGDLNDSVAAWNAACDAIAYRIPPTSPMDAPEVEYGSIQLSGDVAIAAFTIARMNNFDIHQRRQAMASLASLIAAEPTVVGAAVAAILGDAPESVRTTVISLIHEFEQPPYQLTKALQPVLHSLASAANSLSARVFARLLLERAALDAPQPGPSGIPGVVRLSEPALSFTRGAFGSARLAPIEALWPDYGDLAAAALDSNMKSKQHKAQMEAMRDSLGNRAIVFDSRLWWPIDEEIEGALQSTALGLRSAMAMLGQIGSDLEWEPARHLVGDVNIGVRIAMSRTPRPHYYERPDEFPEFAVGKALTVSGDGRYNGWVVLGHRERQLQLAAGFDRKVAAQHDVSSGIVYAGSGEIQRAHGSLPFAAGDGTAWLTPTHSAARVPIHKGPVVAMDIQRDPFGVVEVLSPTPVVRRAASVSPVRPLGGLILTNGSGEPVIVGRCWREPLLENEYVNDRVFEFVGVELIARPDVLDAVGRLTLTGAEYITVHFETNRSEP